MELQDRNERFSFSFMPHFSSLSLSVIFASVVIGHF